MPSESDTDQTRADMRARRAKLDDSTRRRAAERVCRHIQDHHWWDSTKQLAAYIAVGGELDLMPLLELAHRSGKRCLLPVIESDILCFAPWHPKQAMQANQFAIPEPLHAPSDRLAAEELELVLAPLIAFDPVGTRIGMGAGYYDKSFAFLAQRARPSKPKLVGVGYQFQYHHHLQRRSWDIPLDAAVTEEGWYAFSD